MAYRISTKADPTRRKTIHISIINGSYVVKTPYDSAFVAGLKARIPATGRQWDGFNKTWTIAASGGVVLAALLANHYNYYEPLPALAVDLDADGAAFVTTIVVEYIGSVRDGFASVQIDGKWAGKILESAICSWFGVAAPEPDTLYGLLGCSRNATDLELKAAFKSAARRWHPDLNHAENAREMFQKVKEAYEFLSTEAGRNKYDAGLQFEKMLNAKTTAPVSFTPPRKCGELTVRARRELGQLVIEDILEWKDAVNEKGRTMFSSWSGTGVSVIWV